MALQTELLLPGNQWSHGWSPSKCLDCPLQFKKHVMTRFSWPGHQLKEILYCGSAGGLVVTVSVPPLCFSPPPQEKHYGALVLPQSLAGKAAALGGLLRCHTVPRGLSFLPQIREENLGQSLRTWRKENEGSQSRRKQCTKHLKVMGGKKREGCQEEKYWPNPTLL